MADDKNFDVVKHPSHYCFGTIEPIKVIQDWELNFCLGSALKYIARAGKKDDVVQDLRKAIQYLEFEIEKIEKDRGIDSWQKTTVTLTSKDIYSNK